MKKLLRSVFCLILILAPFYLYGQDQEVVVKEDFSKFTMGSEDDPYSKDEADEYTTYIPSELTHKEGWTGAAIHQAGGVCFVSNYSTGWDLEDGYLNTPYGDYSGKITISFRARSKKKYDKECVIYASIASGSTNLGGDNFKLTEEWNNYITTIDVEANDKSQNSFVQFTANSDVQFFIDDITITRQKGLLPYPEVTGYDDLKADGFRANWNALQEIDTYLVSVYSKKEYKATDSIVDSFEDVKLTEDHKLVSNDFGQFKVSLSSENPINQNKDNAKTGDKSLHMISGDFLELNSSSKPIVHASFFAKEVNTKEHGSILIEQYVGNDWTQLLKIDTKGIPDFKFIPLDQYLNFNATAIRIRIEDDGDIYLDDLKVFYEPDHQFVEGYQDKEVTNSTSLTVTGLDPETDYYYSVKAKKGDEISLPSEEVFVFGLVTPVVLEAENIGQDNFTAKWEKTPKADGYLFNNYNLISASEKRDIVIYDENFEKIKKGIDKPNDYKELNKENSFLDKYTTYPGWMGAQTIVADGMIGTKGFGAAIILPSIIFSPQQSYSVKVHIRAWGEKDTDLAVQVNGSRPEGVEAIHFDETGFIEKDITFVYSDKNDMNIGVLSWSGEPFLLDSVNVVATLPDQTSVAFLNNRVNLVKKQTECVVDNLMKKDDLTYYYTVKAFRFIGSNVVFSDLSDKMNVKLKEQIDESTKDVCLKKDITIKNKSIISGSHQMIYVYDLRGTLLYQKYMFEDEIINLEEVVKGNQVVIVKSTNNIHKILL